jgi:hypothetical protein
METVIQPCDGRDDDEDDVDRRQYASVCSTIYIPTTTRTVPETTIPLSIVTTSPISSSSSSSCLNQPSQKYAATSPYYDILLYSPKRHALFMAQPADTHHNTTTTSTTRTRTEILRNQLLQQPSGATTICDSQDKCSDGDQSPITDRTAHSFYMELFRTGS